MSIDLSQFISTFLEESYEGLAIMESSLLSLDSGDTEVINTIFRAAHSIKGGAGTFGFNEVSDFTHDVETLLDELRNLRQPITADIVNLLLQSVDATRALIAATQDGPAVDPKTIESVQLKLQQAINGELDASCTPETAIQAAAPHPVSTQWQIYFKPAESMLQQGHEPGFMLDALQQLGEAEIQAFSEELPQLTDLDPHLSYLGWQINLNADCSEEDIREIFEWVEDECELVILNEQPIPPQPQEGWLISFTPDPALLQQGHEPAFMLEALGELGESRITADWQSLPGLDQIDPEQVHLSWQVQLVSDCSETEIEEIFEWVADECELTITPLIPTTIPAYIETKDTVATAEPLTAIPTSTSNDDTPDNPQPSTTAQVTVESTTVRVDLEKIDLLVNRVGELVITQAMLGQIGNELTEEASSDTSRLMAGLEQLERNTRDLQEDVMRVRMFPISFVFNRFPRLVHDTSGKLGKKVELKISGEQTEIDKTVMEKIGDPLVHLIRNSLDHGLETPERRIAAGKPETGVLQLEAYHQGGFFVIDISDDGQGIDTEGVRQKAIERGLINPEQALSQGEIHELLFSPGFSTAEQVSDLSGRGVGMDVVRRNIEALGGNVRLRSEAGQGTLFSIRLPLTLAIMDGQLVRLGQETYIIPLISIIETILAHESDLSPIAGQSNLLLFRDEYIPLINLHQLFNMQQSEATSGAKLIAIVESAGQKAGLIVDDLFGQQQVVIKSLEQNFKRIDGLTGATILGDGNVALILDIAGLMKRGLDFSLAQAAHKRTEILATSKQEARV